MIAQKKGKKENQNQNNGPVFPNPAHGGTVVNIPSFNTAGLNLEIIRVLTDLKTS